MSAVLLESLNLGAGTWTVGDEWDVKDILGLIVGTYLGFFIELGSEFTTNFASCEFQAVEMSHSLYLMSYTLTVTQWTDIIGFVAGVGAAGYALYNTIDTCIQTNQWSYNGEPLTTGANPSLNTIMLNAFNSMTGLDLDEQQIEEAFPNVKAYWQWSYIVNVILNAAGGYAAIDAFFNPVVSTFHLASGFWFWATQFTFLYFGYIGEFFDPQEFFTSYMW